MLKGLGIAHHGLPLTINFHLFTIPPAFHRTTGVPADDLHYTIYSCLRTILLSYDQPSDLERRSGSNYDLLLTRGLGESSLAFPDDHPIRTVMTLCI